MINAAFLRLCISLTVLCILFLMPSLLLYFLGYLPIFQYNRDDVETSCFVVNMALVTDPNCVRSCNCRTLCHPVGKYTSCSTSCSTCKYTCYYVIETLRVAKPSDGFFNHQLQYGQKYNDLASGESQLREANKYINATYTCYYSDKVSPIKVQFREENDQGFYIATAVVGGLGGLCFLIHITLELYWFWLYRNKNAPAEEKGTEMK